MTDLGSPLTSSNDRQTGAGWSMRAFWYVIERAQTYHSLIRKVFLKIGRVASEALQRKWWYVGVCNRQPVVVLGVLQQHRIVDHSSYGECAWTFVGYRPREHQVGHNFCKLDGSCRRSGQPSVTSTGCLVFAHLASYCGCTSVWR